MEKQNLKNKTKAELIAMLENKQQPIVNNNLQFQGNIKVSNKMNKVNEQQLTNLTEALLNVSIIIRDRNKSNNCGIFVNNHGFKVNNK